MALSVCALALVTGSSQAAAQAGGGGGGVGTPPLPRVTDVRCQARCAGIRKAVVGSTVVVSGKHLTATSRVTFHSRHGRVAAKPTASDPTSVTAAVPRHARSGSVRIRTAYGTSTSSQGSLRIVDHLPPAASFKLQKAQAGPRRAYFDGLRSPKLTYLFNARAPTAVRVEVVRMQGAPQVIRTYVERNLAPNSVQTVTWDGRSRDGRPAPNGKYRFKVGALSGSGADSTRHAKFSFHGNEFPVRGQHTYGDGLGAGRGHQGQDVLTRCGTKLVAARGGRVYYRRYQAGGAGNYVVINLADGRSMVYAHLLHPATVRKGQRVHTGQTIGLVGRTGDATTCHLHFELWSKPGWYQGGSVLNPTPLLRTWDRWS